MGTNKVSSVVDCGSLPIQSSHAYTEDGSLDYKGCPAVRPDVGNLKSVPFLCVMLIVDMMANISILANLQAYLTQKLCMRSADASTTVNNLCGVMYLCPLLGGFMADTYLGRFWGIVLFGIVQIIGSSLLTLAAGLRSLNPSLIHTGGCTVVKNSHLAVHLGALYLISVGTGAMRPCLSSFGADQFDEKDPKEKQNMSAFFNWSFFLFLLGMVVSVTLLVWVQDERGFAAGYMVATVLLVMGLVSVVTGYPIYRYQKPMGSPVTRICQVLVAAVWKRNLHDRNFYEAIHSSTKLGTKHSVLPHTNQLRFLDHAAMMHKPPSFKDTNRSEGDELVMDSPWKLCTVTQVEEVKIIMKMFPILLTTIMLSTCAAQLQTWPILQGLTMKRKLGSWFLIPPPSIGAISFVAMLILIPLYDLYFVPFARRLTGHERGITPLQRIGVGLVFAIFSLLAGAWVEHKRLQIAHRTIQEDEPQHVSVINMSIFWLVPMQMIFGIGEFLGLVGSTEFFYSETPEGMRALAVGLSLSTSGFGSYLSSLLIFLVNKISRKYGAEWLNDDINRGHLDYYYLILAALSTVNFTAFLAAANEYKYTTLYAEAYNILDKDTSVRNSATIPLQKPSTTATELKLEHETLQSKYHTSLGSFLASSPGTSMQQPTKRTKKNVQFADIDDEPDSLTESREFSEEFYTIEEGDEDGKSSWATPSPLETRDLSTELGDLFSPSGISPNMSINTVTRTRFKEVVSKVERMRTSRSPSPRKFGPKFHPLSQDDNSPHKTEEVRDQGVVRLKAPNAAFDHHSDPERQTLHKFSFVTEHFKRSQELDTDSMGKTFSLR